MKVKVDDLIKQCGCRSVGECFCNRFAGMDALEKLVRVFGKAQVSKLRSKYLNGRSGWDDPKIREYLRMSLIDHVAKGDMVDVANIAMFIWNIDQPG